MKSKRVFLVKFEAGYYAEKQPHFHWSFTADPNLAKQYGSRKTAESRAEHGRGLMNDGHMDSPTHQGIGTGKVEIEEYELRTVLERV